MKPTLRRILSLALLAAAFTTPALGVQIAPFQTRNSSPLVQIFGLPPSADPFVAEAGKREAGLSLNISTSYAVDRSGSERIVLDGETYRYGLSFRYGLPGGKELGLELPVYQYGGGVLDSFIIGWHNTFGLPQGGRNDAPKNRYLYQYDRNGSTRLLRDDSGTDLGDLSLTAGWQLYRSPDRDPLAVALRGALKLPTGSSSSLTGSGSTDFSLALAAGKRYGTSWGETAVYGSAGGMALTNGDILRDQQRNFVAFGSLGAGWSPASWIGFKLQLDGHTPFYGGSGLKELSGNALQIVMGGTLGFSPATTLDLGVSEDLSVNAAPDVVFHLNLKHSF